MFYSPSMEFRFLLLFFSFLLVCQQLEAFSGCGDDALTQKLTNAASRAAKWLSENLIDNTTETEGYILGTAFHSLRLVNYPLATTLSNHPTSNIYKEFDVHRTDIGRVAQYVQGYLAVCQKSMIPKQLMDRLKTGIKRCCNANFTHTFQYMTVSLALCNSEIHFSPYQIRSVLKTLMKSSYRSIDAVAMSSIALSCVQSKQAKVWRRKIKYIPYWINRGTKWLLRRQNIDGSFGNSGVTTALAVQAIISSGKWVKQKWQCSKTMKYLLSQQKEDGSFGDLMSTIQILPVLKGKVPQDLEPKNCSIDNSIQSSILHTRTDVEKNVTSVKGKTLINVCLKIHITEMDQRQFDVQVEQGSSVHEVFKTAEKIYKDGQFTFKASETKYGAIIQSICQHEEDPTKRIHWIMYTNPITMATVGIDGLRLENGTCVIFKLMKTSDASIPCKKCSK